MKKIVVLGFIISAVILLLPLKALNGGQDIEAAAPIIEKEEYYEKTEKAESFKVKIGDEISEIAADDYIFGVVSAEMPALYHEEAIKAQAVAAYTYALNKKEANKEKEYDITSDFSTDQSFITREKARENWGENADLYTEKIKKCLEEVKGYIITYKNAPIDAVYHAISSGKTESSKEVWGKELSYLKSVASEGDKLSPQYITKAEISVVEFKEKLKLDDNITIGKYDRTEAGSVKTVKICGKEFKGEEIRSVLGLRSANFKLEEKDDNIIFTVYGYGHGVGMSQYGANIMAQEGADFKQILKHYYSGCKISQ